MKREVLLSARCSSAVASAFSALSRIAEIGLRISWASPAAIRPMAGQSLGNASARRSQIPSSISSGQRNKPKEERLWRSVLKWVISSSPVNSRTRLRADLTLP
jgi:hypothetical protein